jgi:hypothetical protein
MRILSLLKKKIPRGPYWLEKDRKACFFSPDRVPWQLHIYFVWIVNGFIQENGFSKPIVSSSDILVPSVDTAFLTVSPTGKEGEIAMVLPFSQPSDSST